MSEDSGCSRGCSTRQTSLTPTGRNPSGHWAGAARVPAGDGSASGRQPNVPRRGPSTEAGAPAPHLAGGGLRVRFQQDEPTSPLCLPSTYIQTSSEGAFALHRAPQQFLRKENQGRFCKDHKRFLLLSQAPSLIQSSSDQHLWWKSQGFIESEGANGGLCGPHPTPHLPGEGHERPDHPHQPKASALSPQPAARDAAPLQTGQLARGDRAAGSREAEHSFSCRTHGHASLRTEPVNRTRIQKFLSKQRCFLRTVKCKNPKHCFRKDLIQGTLHIQNSPGLGEEEVRRPHRPRTPISYSPSAPGPAHQGPEAGHPPRQHCPSHQGPGRSRPRPRRWPSPTRTPGRGW